MTSKHQVSLGTATQADYLVEITEQSGDFVSREDIVRLCQRYYWAASYCRGKDAIEIACGTGQGLGYLAGQARRVVGGDYSIHNLRKLKQHLGRQLPVVWLDAQQLPFRDGSADVILMLDALYFIPDPDSFVKECVRVLRPGGHLLVTVNNKDLYDFHASQHGQRYFGIIELGELLSKHGFSVRCFGNTPMSKVSPRQKLLRPVKRLAVRLNLIPQSQRHKRWLKRWVFGRLEMMPTRITDDLAPHETSPELPIDRPDHVHKILFCCASLRSDEEPREQGKSRPALWGAGESEYPP